MTAEVNPQRFTEAGGDAGRFGSLGVDGSRVRSRAWRDPSLPGVLVVHGRAAHSR